MDEKGLKSPAIRRVFTIVLLLGVSGTFMAFYYLVYLPHQQADFNGRMFNILHDITGNFSTRVENYGAVSRNSYINKRCADKPVPFRKDFDKNFDANFKSSFIGNPDTLSKYRTEQDFKHDSIIFKLIDTGKNVADRSEKALSDILEPLISIHANTFQSVLLVKLISDTVKRNSANIKKYDAILYKSCGIDIANINMDSLFPNKNIQGGALNPINIGGIKYQLFLMPFQMKAAPNETFVLAGIISANNYSRQAQDIPLDFLITVVFILVFLLLCLPFLKVFVLSSHENISLADVRFMIASIFIIPFIITLLASSIWLYFYPDRFTNTVLSSLQNELKANFYKEIRECIDQANEYDSIISHPSGKIWESDELGKTVNKLRKEIDSIKGIRTPGAVGIKDVVFYPARYKNIENIHWIDNLGKDIAAWRFTKDPASYFNLKDRQYFKDIKYQLGYICPNSDSKDTFTFQATLSKLTAEYTLNVVIPSSVQIRQGKTSIATGISSRMYSVYNTVIPPGFSYCLIDQKGEIVFHSDTARCLQGNLLEETGNNQFLLNAISHKDSAFIDNIQLYDEPVKMIIRPFGNLPYYLVTYYNKRPEYLFIFHIGAFVFLGMSLLLLFVSLFSYCIMMTEKRITKLLFTPETLGWLKPSFERKDFYIRNCILQITFMLLVLLFSVFLSPVQDQLYMLNYALLLPLFSVTGFYIVKKTKNLISSGKEQDQQSGNDGEIDQETESHKKVSMLWIGKKQLIPFWKQARYILLMYTLSILIFRLLQDVLIYNKFCSGTGEVKFRIWVLIALLPFVMCFIAFINIDYFRNCGRRFKPKNFRMHYLTPYIFSLMLGVLAVSVIPSVTLTRYALNEERILHFQTFQIGLAKKMQERRAGVNQKFWKTKLDIFPKIAASFIDSLKFSPEKGLYLGGLRVDTGQIYFSPATGSASESHAPDRTTPFEDTCVIACSPFYKTLTQFLFLPPDHDEFYDNVSHRKFYYWKQARHKITSDSLPGKEVDSLFLYYKNLSDRRNPASLVLGGELPYFYLFQDITHEPYILLILVIIILVFLFYKIINSVARRIFLVGYFGDNKSQETTWLTEKFNYINRDDLNKTFCLPFAPESFAAIREIENQLLVKNDECILKIHVALIPVYERIWKDCTDEEKYALYDFALDGFTNHKKVIILLQLYQKGLLIKHQDNFHLMTISFRNFLLTKEKSETIKALSKQSKGSWATMRTVFYIILLVVAIFIFLSQEEASKRLITIVTSLGALLPAILKLFDKSSFSSVTNKSGQ
ncbi:MAG: hypothetical protein ABI707_02550 [Ferruginibacter sp.]